MRRNKIALIDIYFLIQRIHFYKKKGHDRVRTRQYLTKLHVPFTNSHSSIDVYSITAKPTKVLDVLGFPVCSKMGISITARK